MRPPDFWHRSGPISAVLAPLGQVFDIAGRVRDALAHPVRIPVPVLCIGNLVVGGAGKTPVTAAIAETLHMRGRAPHILSRGYGGRLRGPVRVDPHRHTAAEVGDEPLLLSAVAPTWVSRDRVAGARAAAAAGAGVIVMDDGFQNPYLAKTASWLVVDGTYGFGNGRPMPAGPLRESVARGLARASAAIVLGEDTSGVSPLLADLPVLRGRIVPRGNDATRFAGRPVVAFAGIGRPEKFFMTLRAIGADLVECRAFSDHHPYTPADLAALRDRARARNAAIVTTEKDAVRLPRALREEVDVLAVRVQWDDEAALGRLLDSVTADG
ncbi:MAG: tetraacyldisaccharide 4'-kinase [Alphaproteobacteria bacterium]